MTQQQSVAKKDKKSDVRTVTMQAKKDKKSDVGMVRRNQKGMMNTQQSLHQ